MEDWQIEALEEVAREVRATNPLITAGVSYTEFVSRSNGRNRKKRKKWREIRLVSYGGRTVQIGTRLSKKLERIMQEVYPEDLVVDSQDDWLTSFVNALRELNEQL